MTSLIRATHEETLNVFPIVEQHPVAIVSRCGIGPRGSARLGEGKEPHYGDSAAI